jgi:rhodanese-related sulfurtransferase
VDIEIAGDSEEFETGQLYRVKFVLKTYWREFVKTISTALCLVSICFSAAAVAEESDLDKYIAKFSYQERKDMKITSKELLPLLKEQKVQFVDIRFKEEFEAWRMGFGTNIPINELPTRLNELDKNKVIVTACPHKDRATIAMVYLKTKGFKARYLEDGLVGLAEALRGDTAKEFMK